MPKPPALPTLTTAQFEEKLDALCAARRKRIQEGNRPGPSDFLVAVELAVCATPEQKIRMDKRIAMEEAMCPETRKGYLQ